MTNRSWLKLLWCFFSDIVEELIKSGNVVEAIYVAHEADLLEKFPPVPLLKAYVRDSSDKAHAVLKSGRHSSSALVRISLLLLFQWLNFWLINKPFSMSALSPFFCLSTCQESCNIVYSLFMREGKTFIVKLLVFLFEWNIVVKPMWSLLRSL